MNNHVLAFMTNFAPDYYDRRVKIDIPTQKSISIVHLWRIL